MADEVKPEGAAPISEGAVPAFDPEKMRSVIREELQQHLSTEGKDGSDPLLYAQPEKPRAADPTVNPLQAIIDPLMAPHLQRISLVADGARDAATFYVTHPEAVKYQEDVEKGFNAMMAQGTPLTRDAVWKWYRGQNFDKFLKEAQETTAAQVQHAKDNADGGGGNRPANANAKQAHDASDDELKNALQGVSF